MVKGMEMGLKTLHKCMGAIGILRWIHERDMKKRTLQMGLIMDRISRMVLEILLILIFNFLWEMKIG